jgi:aminodeoxyfutalosine deaminase
MGPSRIAHGASAADDPALLAELQARGVTLDLCPTSNVQASIFPTLADHPLRRLLRAGVPVTLSTDDRTVSDLTLVREYVTAHEVLGVSLAELWQMNMHALRVAFLQHDEPLRASLIEEFEAFAATEPELAGEAQP